MMAAKNSAHSPTLETVLMIEDFIRDNSGKYTKVQVWRNLPRKVMYQTFCVAFDYLTESSKISSEFGADKIVWVWNPELVKKVLKQRKAETTAIKIDKVFSGKTFLEENPNKRKAFPTDG